ncbi:hypothetical protein LIER_10609 [Lithospermum erythrorhizon]|uniref:Lunapark zinc ribbon domain-containing protein n=1 Tax=Lithospermum erythrorhizon TaxID=34254 RepID=A0AAV3PPY0_LITER
MAGDSKKDVVGDNVGDVPQLSDTDQIKTDKKKKKGLLSRLWNGIFRIHGDDFEKRLQYISKEEATVLVRMKKRSQSWRKVTRHLIILSILLEVVSVAYAIMTTRTVDLNWKIRALRVLPMFLLPGLSFLTYSALQSFTKMFDRKDQKTLERLRAERKEKIDELKEKTNYYSTQQLIQRYDPDPAAKAAAASVLASKLGADSGLKVFVGDESNLRDPSGKSNDVELVQAGGLRNRKQLHTSGSNVDSTISGHSEAEMHHNMELEGHNHGQHHPTTVEHFQPKGSATHDGSWISRIAALLVGEDPTQSYALICGNCHMHNGLARKEEFSYITYYCPHCNALNKAQHQDDHISGSNNPGIPSPVMGVGNDTEIVKSGNSSVERVSTSSPVVIAGVAGSAETDKVLPQVPVSN